MKLSNSRASSLDQILAEMIKYGPTKLHSIIAIIMNVIKKISILKLGLDY